MPCKQRAGIRVNRKIVVDIVRNIRLHTHKLNAFVCGNLFETPWHEKRCSSVSACSNTIKRQNGKNNDQPSHVAKRAVFFFGGPGRDGAKLGTEALAALLRSEVAAAGCRWPCVAASGRKGPLRLQMIVQIVARQK